VPDPVVARSSSARCWDGVVGAARGCCGGAAHRMRQHRKSPACAIHGKAKGIDGSGGAGCRTSTPDPPNPYRDDAARLNRRSEWLVAAQIAVSLVLLTGAGMLLRSLYKIESVPLGIQTEHVVTAEFTLGKQRYAQVLRQLAFFNELETHMARIPGVTAMAISDS